VIFWTYSVYIGNKLPYREFTENTLRNIESQDGVRRFGHKLENPDKLID
jgi:hypothetical protein